MPLTVVVVVGDHDSCYVLVGIGTLFPEVSSVSDSLFPLPRHDHVLGSVDKITTTKRECCPGHDHEHGFCLNLVPVSHDLIRA